MYNCYALLACTAHSGYRSKILNYAYAVKYYGSRLAASGGCGCIIHDHTIYHCSIVSLKFKLWYHACWFMCELELRKRRTRIHFFDRIDYLLILLLLIY